MKYITAFFMAWGNFFAVPCPCKWWDNNLRRLQMVFLPLIGIIMGLFWYLLQIGMFMLNIPTQLQAAVLTVYPFLISGFIHLDGFMDCSDAILSRRDLEERQKILKDSHVGAFAVINIVILFLVFYSAMGAILEDAYKTDNLTACIGLIMIPVVSRICSAYGVLKYKPIGHSQYNASFDKNINKKYEIILMVMLILVLALTVVIGDILKIGHTADIAVIVTALAHYLMMWNGRKQLGGMSGDIAGYALTLAECAGVLALAML